MGHSLDHSCASLQVYFVVLNDREKPHEYLSSVALFPGILLLARTGRRAPSTVNMKSILVITSAVLLVANSLGYAEDVTFGNVKLADAKGQQTNAKLIFSDSTKSVVIQVSDRDLVSIPYANLDKLSYEYTKKHRITSGAITMVFSLGAGAIVMLTKSKSNWLYFDYHDQDSKRTVVLKLEKKDLQNIFEAAKTHTGKDVVDLGNAGNG